MNPEELARQYDDLEKRVSEIGARHRHVDEGWAEIRRDMERLRDAEASLIHSPDE